MCKCIILLICVLGLYHNIEKAGFNPYTHLKLIEKKDQLIIEMVISADYENQFVTGDILLSVNDKIINRKEDL